MVGEYLFGTAEAEIMEIIDGHVEVRLKGESEWNRLATDLKALAGAYGAEFPLCDSASVRRVGDRELAGAVDEIARSTERLKRSLDNDLKKDRTVDKSARAAIVREADLLAKDAKTLRGRVKEGNPSSAEAEALLRRAAALQAFMDSHQVPASSSAWAALAPRIRMLSDAYGPRVVAGAR